MKASVVIVTKNQKGFLQQTLPILLHQKFFGGYETIVVDSGSTDGAVGLVKSLPVKLVQIPPENFNYASAFNLGASWAKGEFLVRLSGDCIPQRIDFLTELLRPFSDPRVGATYGRYSISGRPGFGFPPAWSASRFPNKLTRYHIRPNFISSMSLMGETSEKLFNLAGGCCAVRKEIWKKRPFNENLAEAEDAEYAWFLHLIGYDIVYNPRAVCLHEHKISRRFYRPLQVKINWMKVLAGFIKYYFKKAFGSDEYENLNYLKQ